jgi:ubiquinone/menaquinone biosynthesis C-methylase UbiE
MNKNITDKLLSYSREIFYEKISPKYKKNKLKLIMDFLYVIFEKFAIKFNIISLNYLDLYADLVRKEIEMAEITSNDSILVIGCGTLPSTSLLLYNETNAKIVAVDKDKNAINGAKKFLSNIQITDKIILKHANGLDYPLNDFNVIFILYGVKYIEKIIDYLDKKANKNSKIIVRTNDQIDVKLFDKFNIINRVESKYLGEVNSYLISKKN